MLDALLLLLPNGADRSLQLTKDIVHLCCRADALIVFRIRPVTTRTRRTRRQTIGQQMQRSSRVRAALEQRTRSADTLFTVMRLCHFHQTMEGAELAPSKSDVVLGNDSASHEHASTLCTNV